jgi:release factor glutamine methyltransferase
VSGPGALSGPGASEPAATAPIAAAARALAAAGVATPRADAELLASFVLDVPRGRLLLADFPPAALERYRDLVRQRAARTPLQHLTGRAPFRYLELAVGPGVFIPRSETELLVSFGQ